MTIPILFEDGEALVIDKPGGLPIERPRAGGPSLEDHLDELKLGFQRPPVPVHRIDTDTSGCLLLARNPKALKRFARAFEERLVGKRYLGDARGRAGGEGRHGRTGAEQDQQRREGLADDPGEEGQAAVTHWRVLAERDGRALVEFRPETGRTHQIRVHAASGIGIAAARRPGLRRRQGRRAHDAPCRRARGAARGQAADRRRRPASRRFRRAGVRR